jgi:hypothetical protein
VSDRLVRFAGDSWQEIEALPQSVRWTVQRAIFHLLEEPVPALADELHLPSDSVTIWYVVAPFQGQEIVSIQLVRLDT